MMHECYTTVLARLHYAPIAGMLGAVLRDADDVDTALLLLLGYAYVCSLMTLTQLAFFYRSFVEDVLLLYYDYDVEQVARWFEREQCHDVLETEL